MLYLKPPILSLEDCENFLGRPNWFGIDQHVGKVGPRRICRQQQAIALEWQLSANWIRSVKGSSKAQKVEMVEQMSSNPSYNSIPSKQ